MKKYAIKATANGAIDVVEFDELKSYETIKEAIGGGTFDCIRIPSLGVDIWIDDESKLMDEPEYSSFATVLWIHEYGMTDIIAGDVIITGGTDDEGNTLGLTKDGVIETLTAVKQMMERIISIKVPVME